MPGLFDVTAGFVRVAVERGVDRYPEGLAYSVPQELSDLSVGERVIVPLGPADAPTAGYVVERCLDAGVDTHRVKPIRSRDRSLPALPAQLLELARWISGYYCAPIGMALAAMLPAAVKRRIGLTARTFVDLAPSARRPSLTEPQRRVLQAIEALPPPQRPVEMRRLAGLAGLGTTGPIRRLVGRRLLTAVTRSTIEAAWAAQALDTSVPQHLTPKQQRIVDAVGAEIARGGFSAHLLFGVTGSGKTEVYIRLIEQALAAGKAALVLVPEIALTPQTGGRIIGRLPGHRVAILHSGLTSAQRHQQWALTAAGAAKVVLGARSAVFAPVPDGDLGLIVVDEEHDASYKQDQVPRYHGRDVAVRRAQLAGCPVVLGSATPSLESWHNATGRATYRLHRLDERAPGMHLPRVRIVDLAEERRHRVDRRVHLLGPILEGAIARTLDGGGSVLLLLNRRGYARYVACRDHRCGWVMGCEHCDAAMVHHRELHLPAGGFVRCHHCLAEQRLPRSCPLCTGALWSLGLGTQRVEAELARAFPQLVEGRTMLRVDSDAMRSAADMHEALRRFGAGEVRLLVGTQMIAKGLDFPCVRLVGVINADTSVSLPDFRSAERTFQLVSQVAGRCGRGSAPGEVIVQTFQPRMPAIRLAAGHDFEGFAALELAERLLTRLPPVTRMARLVVRDADPQRCRRLAGGLAEGLRALGESSLRVSGPAPCPIARISGRYRQQVELLADSAHDIQVVLAAARNGGLLRPGATVSVDVDPVDLL